MHRPRKLLPSALPQVKLHQLTDIDVFAQSPPRVVDEPEIAPVACKASTSLPPFAHHYGSHCRATSVYGRRIRVCRQGLPTLLPSPPMWAKRTTTPENAAGGSKKGYTGVRRLRLCPSSSGVHYRMHILVFSRLFPVGQLDIAERKTAF